MYSEAREPLYGIDTGTINIGFNRSHQVLTITLVCWRRCACAGYAVGFFQGVFSVAFRSDYM